jgi:hypothetical protein
LAIKGHSTRGKEVIALLEMMGGINDREYIGANTWKDEYYFLDNGYIRAYDWCDGIKFTLEEFLRKYPFKVGDLVDRNIDYVSCIIDDMRWNSEKCCVEYHLNYLNGSEYGWHVSDCLIKPENVDVIIGTKIQSTGFMQMGKTVSVIFNSENYEDEVELQLGDYEIEVRDGKTYAVKKKPVYPKTYEECCRVLGISDGEFMFTGLSDDEYNLFDSFVMPIRCRNAYWKIAGEQMGLDKPWEPDWNDESQKYCIRMDRNKIVNCSSSFNNRILAFPTEEMRDAFYENFKNEIEQCKELL